MIIAIITSFLKQYLYVLLGIIIETSVRNQFLWNMAYGILKINASQLIIFFNLLLLIFSNQGISSLISY